MDEVIKNNKPISIRDVMLIEHPILSDVLIGIVSLTNLKNKNKIRETFPAIRYNKANNRYDFNDIQNIESNGEIMKDRSYHTILFEVTPREEIKGNTQSKINNIFQIEYRDLMQDENIKIKENIEEYKNRLPGKVDMRIYRENDEEMKMELYSLYYRTNSDEAIAMEGSINNITITDIINEMDDL